MSQIYTHQKSVPPLDGLQSGGIVPRFKRAGSVLRFGKLSIASFGINLGLTIALHEWLGISAALSFAITILFLYGANFVAMRVYVFPVRGEPGASVVKQATWFLVSSAVFRGMDYAGFLVLHLVFGCYYLATIIVVTGISFVIKYFFYRRWVFGASGSASTTHGRSGSTER